ncbi:MAG: LysE family translocator [Eubacteriales bacterium]|nr:LysE family translocator [Eubacteriales bacterium]
MIGIFFQSLLIGYSGAVMPGPLLTYNINQSIRVGVRSGLLLITGHALLELVTITLLIFGLGAFLSTEISQIVIGLAGGTVLILFGALMVKDVIQGKAKLDMPKEGTSKSGSLVFNGIVISAMNPYFLIWWTVVGLGLMTAANKAYGLIGIAVFFAGHMLADFSWYVLISFLASRTRTILNAKAYRVIVVVLALVLVGFGVSFLLNAGAKLSA